MFWNIPSFYRLIIAVSNVLEPEHARSKCWKTPINQKNSWESLAMFWLIHPALRQRKTQTIQMIIIHQPKFPWNSRGFPFQTPEPMVPKRNSHYTVDLQSPEPHEINSASPKIWMSTNLNWNTVKSWSITPTAEIRQIWQIILDIHSLALLSWLKIIRKYMCLNVPLYTYLSDKMHFAFHWYYINSFTLFSYFHFLKYGRFSYHPRSLPKK